MKSYTITVNGVSYDVTVEENASKNKNSFINAQAPVTESTVAKKTEERVEEKPVDTNVPKKEVKGEQSVGSIKIEAPMPGKIVAVKASVGQTMKRGDVLLVLEAMKMENEIVVPENGTVVSINANSGDMVEAGVLLATLN
jgi:biotin carboxyl carrier protein